MDVLVGVVLVEAMGTAMNGADALTRRRQETRNEVNFTERPKAQLGSRKAAKTKCEETGEAEAGRGGMPGRGAGPTRPSVVPVMLTGKGASSDYQNELPRRAVGSAGKRRRRDVSAFRWSWAREVDLSGASKRACGVDILHCRNDRVDPVVVNHSHRAAHLRSPSGTCQHRGTVF